MDAGNNMDATCFEVFSQTEMLFLPLPVCFPLATFTAVWNVRIKTTVAIILLCMIWLSAT